MAIKQRGSQNRESIADTDYSIVKRLNRRQILLQNSTGKRELWTRHDTFAGYTLEIDGTGYEFVRSIVAGESFAFVEAK